MVARNQMTKQLASFVVIADFRVRSFLTGCPGRISRRVRDIRACGRLPPGRFGWRKTCDRIKMRQIRLKRSVVADVRLYYSEIEMSFLHGTINSTTILFSKSVVKKASFTCIEATYYSRLSFGSMIVVKHYNLSKHLTKPPTHPRETQPK